MRTLLLLRGAPGAGKSTWIHENNLEPYTLEADKFRKLLMNPILNTDGDVEISQHNDYYAWEMLYHALEFRMQNGDFTIIDATHSNPNMFANYKQLATQYRYRIYYKEFDVDLETLWKRNEERPEHKRVPKDAVERIYTLIHETAPQSYATKIDDISEIINYFTDDLNDYEEVKVIGDIQGCHTVLMEALNNGNLNPTTKYIFSGDLLDRGIENKEVLNFMLSIKNNSNVIFIEGNHDNHLRNWANDSWPERDGKISMPYEFEHCTLPQLLSNIPVTDLNNVKELLDEREATYNHIMCTHESPNKMYKRYIRNRLELPQLQRQYEHEVKKYNTALAKLKSDVRILCSRMRLAYPFTFGNHKILVTHAGVSSVPNLTTISAKQMIYGVGNYETAIDEIYEQSYQAGKTQGFTQIHGHRHTESTKHSICLEDSVEFGGNLKVAVLTKESLTVESYKNDVFRDISNQTRIDYEDRAWLPKTANDTTNQMIQNRYIDVKQLSDNLLSLNFSEAAFKKNRWNKQTIKARGLFVDKETGDIKLRSYNKFFNLNEQSETKVENLKESLEFPIKAYKKYNGFLGVSATIDDTFVLASKSTTSGPYKQYFQDIFDTLSDDEKQQFKDLSVKYNCSFVFEVCHTDDRHIIDFSENHLYVLDAIPNTYDINGIDIDAEFSDKVCSELKLTSPQISRKELVATFDSMDDLLAYVSQHTDDDSSEGLVIEDQKGFLFKVKYDYYRHVKHYRSILERVCSSKTHSDRVPYHTMRTADEIKFTKWLDEKPLDNLLSLHIIDAYKDYMASK